MTTVKKKDGSLENFSAEKVSSGVSKAMASISYEDEILPVIVAKAVSSTFSGSTEPVPVGEVHKEVENTLMRCTAYDVAREYITYRDRNKPDIFRPRVSYRPFEYPQFREVCEAIEKSYWVVGEFDYTGDVQDFHSRMSKKEKSVVTNSMLALSQIEAASVKTFWAKLYDRMPKPEVNDVGVCFADSERRHSDAYAELIHILGLDHLFEGVTEVPAIKKRIAYLKKFVSPKDDSNKEYMQSILLFSMFIENVSLFSQFVILMSFDKYKNQLTGLGTAVQATSAEENIHAMFGADLIRILRDENPHWFDDELVAKVHEAAMVSFEAELGILDWIFEEGDLDFITKYEVIEFVKDRFNRSMEDIDFPHIFTDVDQNVLEKFDWFNVQINSTAMSDFFARRSTEYNVNQNYSEESIW